MTTTEIVEKAREIEREMHVQYKAEKVFELAERGMRLLGNHDLDEEGIEVKVDILKFAIQVYAMNHQGHKAFPYLISYRQLVEIDGKIATPERFAFMLLICLPQIAEMESVSDQQLEGLIAEVKQRVDDSEEFYAAPFTLLEVYRKRNNQAQVDSLKAMLLKKAVPIADEVRNCDSCIKNFKLVKQVQLGLIEEAEQTMTELMNMEDFKCARSPRMAARAMLNYYLEQNDLESAQPHADLLSEYIDFGWQGSIYFANPLFEYFVRTGNQEQAQFWYNRFKEDMDTTPLSLEKQRFWKWAGELVLNK